MSNIGKRIQFKRKALNMTQEELATKMGYKSKSTINKIELGINDIPQSKIVQFAVVLDTTPAYLLGIEEKNSSPSEDDLSEGERALLDLFRRVPEDKQALVLQMIQVALGSIE